jgi:hypothetical protein
MRGEVDEMSHSDSFGPSVIFAAFVESGAAFSIVGVVTHFARDWFHQQFDGLQSVVHELPSTHAGNLRRVAVAMARLGIERQVVERFVRDAFESPVSRRFVLEGGDVRIEVRPPTNAETELSASVTISISLGTPALRAYVETGKYPGLDEVLEVCEVWDSAG